MIAATSTDDEAWRFFQRHVALIIGIEHSEVSPGTPLRKLGIDSLAWVELGVFVLEEYGELSLIADGDVVWRELTVGSLYARCVKSASQVG